VCEVRRHPTVDVFDSVGRESAALAVSLIDRLRIAIPEVFNDHE
jgi:hypothetical protein